MTKAVAFWVCVAILLATAAQHVQGQDKRVCMLTLQIVSQQSPWTGKGSTKTPFPATITSVPLKAVGKVYVQVPTTSSCPPELSPSNASSLFERSSLVLPMNDSSVTFKPVDIKSNVTAVDAEPGSIPRITFDFDGLGLGFTGTSEQQRLLTYSLGCLDLDTVGHGSTGPCPLQHVPCWQLVHAQQQQQHICVSTATHNTKDCCYCRSTGKLGTNRTVRPTCNSL